MHTIGYSVDRQVEIAQGLGHEEYTKRLGASIQSLKGIQALANEDKQERIETFMDSVGSLFLEHFQDYLPEAKQGSHSFQSILQEAAPWLRKCYLLKLENLLLGTFEGYGEWNKACRQRTNIEAFNTMFHDVALPLDLSDVESYMQQKKELENIDPKDRPSRIPTSHWWWFT